MRWSRRRYVKCLLLLALSATLSSILFMHTIIEELDPLENPGRHQRVSRVVISGRALHQCRFANKTTVERDYALIETSDIRAYVRPGLHTTMIEPQLCGHNHQVFLLVAVYSAAFNFDRRSAVRATWGRDLLQMDPDIRLFFLTGRAQDEDTNQRLVREATFYGDIVQEDFCDSYFNVTLKAVFLLKWALRQCPQAKFVLKTDDDTFVHPQNIMNLLDTYSDESTQHELPRTIHTPKGASRRYLMMGKDAESYLQSERKEFPHWQVSQNYSSRNKYPSYLTGLAYVFTGSLLPVLYEEALNTKFIHLEDVFLTGLVAKERLQLVFNYHPGFSNCCTERSKCAMDDVIATHDFTPRRLRTTWSDANFMYKIEFNMCYINRFKKIACYVYKKVGYDVCTY